MFVDLLFLRLDLDPLQLSLQLAHLELKPVMLYLLLLGHCLELLPQLGILLHQSLHMLVGLLQLLLGLNLGKFHRG